MRLRIYERYLIGTNGMMQLKDEYELLMNGEKLNECDRTSSNFT